MREYTPENSIYEEDIDYRVGHDDENQEESRTRVILRAVNGVLHVTTCALLLSIIGKFMHDANGRWYRSLSPEAVVLFIVTAIDILLDAGFIILQRRKWPAWALLLRLGLAIGYLAVFLTYVGLGRAFPRRFTYWGMDRAYTGPVAYLFLWLLGVWNLVHTAIHRRRLGNGIAGYVMWLTRGRVAPPQRRRRSNLWTRRRAVRRERAAREADLERNARARDIGTRSEGDAIALQVRSTEENKSDSVSSVSSALTIVVEEDDSETITRPSAVHVGS